MMNIHSFLKVFVFSLEQRKIKETSCVFILFKIHPLIKLINLFVLPFSFYEFVQSNSNYIVFLVITRAHLH